MWYSIFAHAWFNSVIVSVTNFVNNRADFGSEVIERLLNEEVARGSNFGISDLKNLTKEVFRIKS